MSPRNPTGPPGAVLIEAVAVVGIIATAILPIVGLLALATEQSTEAVARTTGAQISSDLLGQLQQADWEEVGSWDGRDFFFDDQGRAVAGAADSIYTARVTFPKGATQLGSAARPNPHLRQVLVYVSPLPGDVGALSIEEAEGGETVGRARLVQQFRSAVVRRGK